MRTCQRRQSNNEKQTNRSCNSAEIERNFKKEEYNSLRKEVENTLNEISNTEKNCLLVVAALYAWIFTNKIPKEFDNIIWFIPPLFTTLSILRTIALNKHITLLGRYLLQIEQHFLSAPGEGWESFFNKNGRGDQTIMRVIYWGLFLIITFTAYCLHYAKQHPGYQEIIFRLIVH